MTSQKFFIQPHTNTTKFIQSDITTWHYTHTTITTDQKLIHIISLFAFYPLCAHSHKSFIYSLSFSLISVRTTLIFSAVCFFCFFFLLLTSSFRAFFFFSYFHNTLCVLHLVSQSLVDIQTVRTLYLLSILIKKTKIALFYFGVFYYTISHLYEI